VIGLVLRRRTLVGKADLRAPSRRTATGAIGVSCPSFETPAFGGLLRMRFVVGRFTDFG
jgi:hypothetical protein